MTIAITGRCLSAGSILLESNILESDISVFQRGSDPDQYPSDAEAYVLAINVAFVFPGANEREVPAAPFDNPSIVPLHSHASAPVQPRRTIFIRDLGDPRLSLVASIPIALDFWGDSVTACCYDLEDFGVGQDDFSALADLKTSLADLYFLLKADAENLGPLPRRQWDYLRQIIREK